MTPPCSMHHSCPVGVAVAYVGNIHKSSNTAGRMSCGLFLLWWWWAWYAIYTYRPPLQGSKSSKALCRRIRTSRFDYKVLRHCHFTGHLQETLSLPLLFALLVCLLLLSRQEADLRVDASPKERIHVAHHRPGCQLSISKQPTRVVKSLLLQQLDGAMRAFLLHACTSTAGQPEDTANAPKYWTR